MMQTLKNLGTNLGIIREFLKFLWARKLWWLIPLMVVLLLFGFLMIFATSTGLGPFMYAFF